MNEILHLYVLVINFKRLVQCFLGGHLLVDLIRVIIMLQCFCSCLLRLTKIDSASFIISHFGIGGIILICH